MKRDMDFVRELLLQIESLDAPKIIDLLPENATEEQRRKYEYHLDMLVNQVGFVKGVSYRMLAETDWANLVLTWKGHEFLDDVRDPEIWKRAKDGASKVGSAGIEFMWEAAKAYARHLAKEKLGLEIG